MTRALRLSKETLTELSSGELAIVAGGVQELPTKACYTAELTDCYTVQLRYCASSDQLAR
jgi:hypothetical protein